MAFSRSFINGTPAGILTSINMPTLFSSQLLQIMIYAVQTSSALSVLALRPITSVRLMFGNISRFRGAVEAFALLGHYTSYVRN
jgi:hypothetical protein